MEKENPMVKLQKSDKVVLVHKPQTFAEMVSLFKDKFKLRKLENPEFVFYDGDDEITLESDEDLANAYEYASKGLKIHLRDSKPATQRETPLDMGHIAMYSEFLEAELPEISEVAEIIENGKIPCKECFFDRNTGDDSFDLEEDYECSVCNGKGYVVMSKSWKLVSLLIDYKIKEYVLDPLKSFQGDGNSSGQIRNGKMLKVAKQLPRHDSGIGYKEDSRTTDGCHSFLSRTNCKVTSLFRNTETYRDQPSLVSGSHATKAPKSLQMSNPISRICIASGNSFNIKTSSDSDSPNENIPSTINDVTADTRLYTMCQLNFVLMEGEGLICTDNTIEIKLLLDNRTDYDWPDNVHIKGKQGCIITDGVDYVISHRIKKCSATVVKFTFSGPADMKLDDKEAVFEMQAIDDKANMKYFSNEIRVILKKKKPDSIFSLCRLIS